MCSCCAWCRSNWVQVWPLFCKAYDQILQLHVVRLDTDPNSGLCRLAFHGKVLWMAASKERDKVAGELVQLKVAKDKQKQGVVERASNSQEVNSFTGIQDKNIASR